MSSPITAPNLPSKPAPPDKGLIPESLKTVLIFILLLAVGYILYDNYRSKEKTRTQLLKIADQIQTFESFTRTGEAKISDLRGKIDETQSAVGNTKAELKKTAEQMQAEGQKTKSEFSKALASKADSAQVQAQVQAAKSEAENKIGQVSSEVGGVKTEVGAVKSDLANTKRDLEGTQRQLVDVRETLSAAVAKNSTELAELRRKGERDYVEFEIPQKNQLAKVEDIRLILTKTDPKKGKFNLKIVVDDNQLEKKDRVINEPIQFMVGHNRVRYELVVNWVQKNRVGGYLSVPKDKSLSAERSTK